MVAGVDLEAATQLAISIMGALSQPECAALPPGDVMGAAVAAHMATRLCGEPVAQRRIASAAVAVLSLPHELVLTSSAIAEPAISVVRTHRSCISAQSLRALCLCNQGRARPCLSERSLYSLN